MERLPQEKRGGASAANSSQIDLKRPLFDTDFKELFGAPP